MKTIRKVAGLIMCLLAVVVFTGCKNMEEPEDLGSRRQSNDVFNEEKETDDMTWIDNCSIYPAPLEVRIFDKNGNNLLDITNPDNVIFDVEADETYEDHNRHHGKAHIFTIEDLRRGIPAEWDNGLLLIPWEDEGDSVTTLHFEFFHQLVDGIDYETVRYEYDLTLYIGDDWKRTYHVIYESYSKDNPLHEQYGDFRWIVDGEVIPDNDFTVII